MKNYLLVVFFLFGNICKGQIFTVSSDKNNVIYKGVENPLTIIVQNVSPADVIAKAEYGRLTGKEGHYMYYSDTGSAVNIVVFKKTRAGEKIIGLYPFRVKQIPDPEAKVAGKPGGNIPVAALRSQSRITTNIEAFNFEQGLPIVSFTLSVIRNNDFIQKEIQNSGEEFNEQVKNALQQIRAGDSVIFKDIVARRHDSTLTILAPLTFSATASY